MVEISIHFLKFVKSTVYNASLKGVYEENFYYTVTDVPEILLQGA